MTWKGWCDSDHPPTQPLPRSTRAKQALGYNSGRSNASTPKPCTTGNAGRALPMTVGEIPAQAVEVARGLDFLDDMGDEDEQRQTFNALMNAIDEEPLSPRRRFRQ